MIVHMYYSLPISVPNYLSLFMGTEIIRNLLGIFKFTQLRLEQDLNQLSYKLFSIHNRAITKKIWFDQVGV
jgi:hypothetical protein